MISVDGVAAGAAVLTRARRAFITVDVAVDPAPAMSATAGVVRYLVDARTVEARSRGTLVNITRHIKVAVFTFKTISTAAAV